MEKKDFERKKIFEHKNLFYCSGSWKTKKKKKREKGKIFDFRRNEDFSKTKIFFLVISFKLWGDFGAPGKKPSLESKKSFSNTENFIFAQNSEIPRPTKKFFQKTTFIKNFLFAFSGNFQRSSWARKSFL